MHDVAIIGAGGHGREIADIFWHQIQDGKHINMLGFIDDNPALDGKMIDDLPILGNWEWLSKQDKKRVSVIIAVGNPQIHKKIALKVLKNGFKFTNAVSPLARISPFAEIGNGIAIFPQAIINPGSSIGNYCIINVAATISHDTKVGPFTNINPGAHLAGNVIVGEGCYIGMGSNIIQGTTIGKWSVLGAGSAVIRDIPVRSTAVGVPAKIIKIEEEN